MSIPAITAETPLPIKMELLRPGGPLEGLRPKEVEYGRIRARYLLMVWEEDDLFMVMTIGGLAQTKRREGFALKAEMVAYVNAWLRRTVKRGRALREKQQGSVTP